MTQGIDRGERQRHGSAIDECEREKLNTGDSTLDYTWCGHVTVCHCLSLSCGETSNTHALYIATLKVTTITSPPPTTPCALALLLRHVTSPCTTTTRGHVGSSSSQPILSTRCHNRAGPATCESDWGAQPEKLGDRARRRGREKEREGKGESERERERRGERKRERERREGEGQPARPPTLTDGAPNVPCIFIETDTSEDPSKWL